MQKETFSVTQLLSYIFIVWHKTLVHKLYGYLILWTTPKETRRNFRTTWNKTWGFSAFISLSSPQRVPNSLFHCMWACPHRNLEQMLRFTGTTEHFSHSTILKNNLTESQDLKGFLEWNCWKWNFRSGAKIWSHIKSHKRKRRGSLEIQPPVMPFTPARLPFSERKSPPGKNHWLM